MTEVLGKEILYQDVSEEETREIMTYSGLPEWYIDDLLKLYRQFQEGKGERIWQDFERITGKRPRAFKQFARDYSGVFRGDIPVDTKEIY